MNSQQLLSLVERYSPPTWESHQYGDKIYLLFPIGNYDPEYVTVTSPFKNRQRHITKVERVQHPYRYGQYLLRKEQLQTRLAHPPEEETKYHAVSPSNVKVAVETSCDVRKYEHYTRTPSFYSTPDDALSVISGTEKAVIVLKQLRSSTQDVCPMYVVYISN